MSISFISFGELIISYHNAFYHNLHICSLSYLFNFPHPLLQVSYSYRPLYLRRGFQTASINGFIMGERIGLSNSQLPRIPSNCQIISEDWRRYECLHCSVQNVSEALVTRCYGQWVFACWTNGASSSAAWFDVCSLPTPPPPIHHSLSLCLPSATFRFR